MDPKKPTTGSNLYFGESDTVRMQPTLEGWKDFGRRETLTNLVNDLGLRSVVDGVKGLFHKNKVGVVPVSQEITAPKIDGPSTP